MKKLFLITLCQLPLICNAQTIGSDGYYQTYKNLAVYQNKKNGAQALLQSIDGKGSVEIDKKKRTVVIGSLRDGVIIQGHSMQQLTPNRFRFHKYDKENSDFELEIIDGAVVLYTHLAFWWKGFRYKIVFNVSDDMPQGQVLNTKLQRQPGEI